VDARTSENPPACGFPRERLIAYRDGTLRAAQLEIAQAHVSTCPDCRAALHAMDEVDRLLREAAPDSDDAGVRGQIKQRVASLPAPRPPRGSVMPRSRVVLALTLVILLVGASVVWLDSTVQGGSTFARWIRGEPWSFTIRHEEAAPAATPLALTPTLVLTAEPRSGDLTRVGTGRMGDGIGEHYYRREDGLNLLVIVDHTGASFIIPPQDPNLATTLVVDGREIHVQTTATERTVSSFVWTAGQTFVSVLVLEQPPGGLCVADVEDIARALLADPLLEQ
jgi:hypothetical protein